MKTAKEILKEKMLELKNNWRGATVETSKTFENMYISAMIDFALEVVKEDRKQIAAIGKQSEELLERGKKFKSLEQKILNFPLPELK